MPPQKGNKSITVDDELWGSMMLIAHSRRQRISDYIEPFFVEILHLEKEGQDPLTILKRARKKKEGI